MALLIRSAALKNYGADIEVCCAYMQGAFILRADIPSAGKRGADIGCAYIYRAEVMVRKRPRGNDGVEA